MFLVVRNPYAGVGNGEVDFPLAAWDVATRRDTQFHPPFLGELYRIARQISQDLIYPCLVSDQGLRHIVSHHEIEIKPLVLRCGKKDVFRIFHAFPQRERLLFYREFTHLDLCQVEDVVEDTDQGTGR